MLPMPDIADLSSYGLKPYGFLEKLAALSCVEAVYLYGSRARGEFDDWSDVDLAIDCPHASEQDWQTIQEIVSNADIMVNVHAVRFDVLPDDIFKQQIMRDKEALYAHR